MFCESVWRVLFRDEARIVIDAKVEHDSGRMVDVLIVIHESDSTSGTTERWCRERRLSHETILGSEISTAPAHRALIVMGGDMETWETEKYPWLTAEKRFIGESLRADKKIFGVCLGGQLLAEQAGAKISSMKKWEIGWFPISYKRGGEWLFSPLHWHSSCFTLPPNAKLIATNSDCATQGFELSPRQLGFQFHTEIDETRLKLVLSKWSSRYHGDVESKQSLEARAAGFMEPLREWYFSELDAWWSA